MMKLLAFAALLAGVSANTCGTNCPSNTCADCPCGTAKLTVRNLHMLYTWPTFYTNINSYYSIYIYWNYYSYIVWRYYNYYYTSDKRILVYLY